MVNVAALSSAASSSAALSLAIFLFQAFTTTPLHLSSENAVYRQRVSVSKQAGPPRRGSRPRSGSMTGGVALECCRFNDIKKYQLLSSMSTPDSEFFLNLRPGRPPKSTSISRIASAPEQCGFVLVY